MDIKEHSASAHRKAIVLRDLLYTNEQEHFTHTLSGALETCNHGIARDSSWWLREHYVGAGAIAKAAVVIAESLEKDLDLLWELVQG